MRPTLPLLLCAALTTTACARISDSRLNPLNWFQRSTVSAPVDAAGNIRPLVAPGTRDQIVDGRVLANTITGLEIARTPEGGIVTATATAPAGAFNAQLVPIGQDGGTLTLAFRVEQGPTQGGTQSITAARFFDNAELASFRTVVVQAQQNNATSRR